MVGSIFYFECQAVCKKGYQKRIYRLWLWQSDGLTDYAISNYQIELFCQWETSQNDKGISP